MTRTRRDPLWIGIQRHGAGYRAFVSRGRGVSPIAQHFSKDTDPRTIQAWRADTKASLRLTRKQRAFAGQFETDARRYLKTIAALPTIKDREREIELWIAAFGTRRREDIRPSDIRAVRDRWLTEPRAKDDERPVSPATVNKRLRALSNLWTVLDGRQSPNPVREVPEAQEPAPRTTRLDFETIERAIEAMPASASRARIRVLAYTGWTGSDLGRMTAEHVDLKTGTADVPPRRKGKGAAGVTVRLLPQAVEALKDLDRLNAWGPFSRSSLWRSFSRALRRADLPPARVYDLRHHFLAFLGQASGDERAVQAIARHGDIRTTRRYTESRVAPRIEAAMAALSSRIKRD